MKFPFTRDRFVHGLVEQDGNLCLVERRNELTDSLHWEVVILQHEPAKTIRGRAYPAHLRYPSSSDWGTHGWTYTNITEARERYRALAESTPQKGGSPAELDPDP